MLGSSQMDRTKLVNAIQYVTLVMTGLMLGSVSTAQTSDAERLEENKRIARAFCAGHHVRGAAVGDQAAVFDSERVDEHGLGEVVVE